MSATLLIQLIITPLRAIFYSKVNQGKVLTTKTLVHFYTFVFSGFQNLFLEIEKILSITKISRNTLIIKTTLPTTVH